MVARTNSSVNAKGVLAQRRRAACRANSHVWGSQNDSWMVSGLVRRCADDPAKMDSIVLSRQQGLRRLRADATVYLMAMKLNLANRDAPSGQDDPLKNALDPAAAAATGMPLIPEFPQYRSLLELAAQRADWQLSEFEVYRLRVPYPIMGAIHRVFFFDPLQKPM